MDLDGSDVDDTLVLVGVGRVLIGDVVPGDKEEAWSPSEAHHRVGISLHEEEWPRIGDLYRTWLGDCRAGQE